MNKGVLVSIINTASIITLALPKSDNNNNNIYINLLSGAWAICPPGHAPLDIEYI